MSAGPGTSLIEPLRPGEPGRIGPYEILGRIGHGGQGRVYLGRRDGGPGVAVKVLGTTQSTHDTNARRRFAQELMAARRVPQACTAVVLDADLAGDLPYIVSEYVPGPSLQQAVDAGGVSAGAALERLATYTATALAAIHGARVVHRDFKPSNVLLGPDGPRVVDFGIAQALESTSADTTGIIGTCPYMAPEQFSKGFLGPAVDVHAWAATMVFAATGRPPFGDGELAAVMFRILHQPPRLDGVPEPLRTLVARCLAKNPDHRPTALQALQFLIGHDTTHLWLPAPTPGAPAPPSGALGPAGIPDPPSGVPGPAAIPGPSPGALGSAAVVDPSPGVPDAPAAAPGHEPAVSPAPPERPATKWLPDVSPGSTKRLPDGSPALTGYLPDPSPDVSPSSTKRLSDASPGSPGRHLDPSSEVSPDLTERLPDASSGLAGHLPDSSLEVSPGLTKGLSDASPGSAGRLPDPSSEVSPGSTKRLSDASPGSTGRPPGPLPDVTERLPPGPPDAAPAEPVSRARPHPASPPRTDPPETGPAESSGHIRPDTADFSPAPGHAGYAPRQRPEAGLPSASADDDRPPGTSAEPADPPRAPSPDERTRRPSVPPLYVTVGDVVHTLDGDRPYTIGGPGSTIAVPGLDVPGDLIYIRHRGVWRLNVRLPGAEIRVGDARRDDRTVAFTEPSGRCVVRGEAAGTRIACEISLTPPPPPPSGREQPPRPASSAAEPDVPTRSGRAGKDAAAPVAGPDGPVGSGWGGGDAAAPVAGSDVPVGSGWDGRGSAVPVAGPGGPVGPGWGGADDAVPVAGSPGPGVVPVAPVARPGAARQVGAQVARHPIGEVTVLGSGAGADIVVPGVDVAAEHATLLRTTGGFRLRDHGRGGGTFVRGRSVLWASLEVGDDFAIGGTTFRLVSESTLETRPEPRADLIVHELSARYGSTPALSGLSFALGDGQFMAIVGPSGSGKSSLFRALLGELPSTGGTLVFRGLNLVADAERIRHLLGYVPQQDHLHRSLTVRRNLRYAARLRLPADLTRRAREERVVEVCERLGLGDHLDARADTLSGGERKRLSIALEILSEPLLLLLDEPTSGLDPGLDREVMRLLREIADRGCSIIVVTHTPDNLGFADQVLVMGNGGRAAYVGPPGDILAALSARDFPELMRELATRPAVPAGPGGRSGSTAPTPAQVPPPSPGPPPAGGDGDDGDDEGTVRPRRAGASASRQFRIFAGRQAALLRARGPLGLLMPFGLAVIGALIIAALAGASTDPAGLNRSQVLTTLVIVSALVGQALTYNNLVSEYEITTREYRTGLSPGALVLGKFVVFAVVALVQGLLAAVVYGAARGSPPAGLLPVDPVVELALPLTAVALASAALGLALSALASTAEKAVGLVTVAAIVQVALNGFALTLTGPLAAVGALVPARWGVAAGAASQNLRTRVRDDPLWAPTIDQFVVNLAMLGVLTVVFVAAAWLILRRRLSRAT